MKYRKLGKCFSSHFTSSKPQAYPLHLIPHYPFLSLSASPSPCPSTQPSPSFSPQYTTPHILSSLSYFTITLPCIISPIERILFCLFNYYFQPAFPYLPYYLIYLSLTPSAITLSTSIVYFLILSPSPSPSSSFPPSFPQTHEFL